MTEGSSLESKIDQLSNHLISQARFTRTLVVVCTAAIVAVNWYVLTQTVNVVPDLVVAKFMSNMSTIAEQWNLTQSHLSHKIAPEAK